MPVVAETRPAVKPANTIVEAQTYESMNFLPDGFEWDRSKVLRIALIGQKEFGKDSLAALQADGHSVVQVYGVPSEKDELFKEVSEQNAAGSEISFYTSADEFKPGTSKAIIERMQRDEVDLIVMAFVDEYVSSLILGAPPKGAVEYHPSKLPESAGSASIPDVLNRGKKVTAMSLIKPGKVLDAGPILAQVDVRVDESDTVFSLNGVMGKAGAFLLRDGVRLIAMGQDEWAEQDLTKRTENHKLFKKDAEIDHAKPARDGYNKARSTPHLGSFAKPDRSQVFRSDTAVDDKTRELIAPQNRIFNLGGIVSLIEGEYPNLEPGQVAKISNEGLEIAAPGGAIRYSEVTVSMLDDQGNEIKSERGDKLVGEKIGTVLYPGFRFAVGKAS